MDDVQFLRQIGYDDAADALDAARSRGSPCIQVLPTPGWVAGAGNVWLAGSAERGGEKFNLMCPLCHAMNGRHAVTCPKLHAVAATPQEDRGVVTPGHYSRHPMEPTQVTVENFGPSFLIGNIMKYIMRYDAKDGHKDLAKAARYVEMLRAYEAGDPDWYKAVPSVPLPDTVEAPLRSRPSEARTEPQANEH